MEIFDQAILAYLHDAKIDRIVYEFNDSSARSLILLVTCDDNAGYSAWNGKYLKIKLQDIVMCSFFAFAAVIGKEGIVSWHNTVSQAAKSEIDKLDKIGIDCKGIQYSISFISGSILEGLCKHIIIEEMPQATL